MSTHEEERPVELPAAVAEEDISPADAAERLDEDPDEQPNHTDRAEGRSGRPDDG